ncbi:integrase [Streptomyces sp. NPDC102441]
MKEPLTEWAGNSVPVLPAVHARCVSGQLSGLKKRMEAGEGLPELPDQG